MSGMSSMLCIKRDNDKEELLQGTTSCTLRIRLIVLLLDKSQQLSVGRKTNGRRGYNSSSRIFTTSYGAKYREDQLRKDLVTVLKLLYREDKRISVPFTYDDA